MRRRRGQQDRATIARFSNAAESPYESRGVAVNHKGDGRLGCLVGMASIERRGWVVLDPKLDGLRNLWPGHFGDDAECEVDARGDAARGEDMAVADDPTLLVTGADQRQQVYIGPMGRSPAPPQQSSRAKKKRSHAHGGDVLGALALARPSISPRLSLAQATCRPIDSDSGCDARNAASVRGW